MKNRSLLLLALILFGFSPFVGAQEKKNKPSYEVIILHTNDMHSKIDNLARLAYLADSLRAGHKDVFLVAAGDNFTGNPLVDMVADKGYPMIDLMNRSGFNVSAVGNHEFDMGQDLLLKRLRQAGFPFISCNTDATKATIGPLKPWVAFGTQEGDTLAFLGIIQLDDNGLPSSNPAMMKGISFTNGLVKAREYTWLKERYGNLIALSHLGIDDDLRLADSLPQFDLIIGGHSHTLLEKPRMENGVMIVQAGSNLLYTGKTTLMVKNGRINERRDEVIPLSSIHGENAEVRRMIDQYNKNKEFDEIIAVAKKPVNGLDELGSMMTDALTSLPGVDIAFQNRGGIRLESLPQGNITLRDIYKLDPFNNQVSIFSMTPAEIKSLICYGYGHEKDIDLQVSGMTYRLTTDGKGKCTDVEMSDRSGRPMDPEKHYRVAMNGYMASTYIFDHSDPGTSISYRNTELLIRFLKEKKEIDYSGVIRAFIVK